MASERVDESHERPLDFFRTWFRVTFRSREFFSSPLTRRSQIGPVAFALLLSLMTASVTTAIDFATSKSPLTPGAMMSAVLLSILATFMGTYASASVIHVLLRVLGTGRGTRQAPEVKSTGLAGTNIDEPYAPPAATVLTGSVRPGPFGDTLQAVGYAHAPLVFQIFGGPGQSVATIWWLVVLIVALSGIHRMSLWRSVGVTLTTIAGPVVFLLTLRFGVVEAFKIPSGAMIPSLMIGDHIFVSKLAYGPLLPESNTRLFSRLPPNRGDVMVFKFPQNKAQDFVKRAIAIPGDTLEVIDGRPILNGWLVPHCYVGKFGLDEGRLYVEFLGDSSYLTLFATDKAHPDGPDARSCTSPDDCEIGQTCRVGICGHYQGPFKVRPDEVWVMGDNRHNSYDSRSWGGGQGAGVPFENIKGRAVFVWMSFRRDGGIAQDRLFVNMTTPTIPGDPDPKLRSALDKCMRERPDIAKTTPPASNTVKVP